MMRIRIRIRIHGSAFRNCGSGSGSRLIYEQISYTRCKSKTFNFFTFLFQKKYQADAYLLALRTRIAFKTSSFSRLRLSLFNKRKAEKSRSTLTWVTGIARRRRATSLVFSELSSSTDLSRLLAIFLYPWIRIWIRIKMRIRIRIQRPKNMRIHADPDPDPDPKHWFL